MAFWLSHVPRQRLDAFLEMVAAALEPDGKVFFVDSHRERKSSTETVVQSPPESGSQGLTRRRRGRAYPIVKNFYEPVKLAERCAAAGLPRHDAGDHLSLHLWHRKPRAVMAALVVGVTVKRTSRVASRSSSDRTSHRATSGRPP